MCAFGLLDPVSAKVGRPDVAIGKEIAEPGLGEANRVVRRFPLTASLPAAGPAIWSYHMTINEERKQQPSFSRPYYLAGSRSWSEGQHDHQEAQTSTASVLFRTGLHQRKERVEKAPQAQMLPCRSSPPACSR
jgi:hypothetical protein